MTTEQILQHIRDVCGLKRLEFGCEVKVPNVIDTAKVFKVSKDDDGTPIYYLTDFIYEWFYESELEIIGLPIYLEHLLYAIQGKLKETDSIMGVPTLLIGMYHHYDLTRTVEQNLTDNTELRELIISLIK